MAHTQLASFNWGSGPSIPVAISYDKQRSGADMQYKIKVVFSAITGSHYFGYPIYLGIKLDNTAKVSGYTVKAASPSQWGSAITYESGWLTVSGKTSGLTALAVNIYSGSGSTRNNTYSFSLAVDPAASTASVPDGTLGQAVNISVTRLGSFTHELYWRAGGSGWQLITTGVGTSYSWTPAVSMAQYNTKAESVVVEFSCETYKNNTHIGSFTTSAKMAIPPSVKPTISGLALTDPDGYRPTYNGYVQNRSRLQVSVTGAGAQGSTITGYSIVVSKGSTTLWTYSGSSVTTPALPESGTLTITATATDSRGRTGTSIGTITVVPYTAPTVSAFTVSRCNAGGAAQADGAYCKATFSASITALGSRNTAAYKIGHREKGASSWTEITVTAAAGNYTPSNVAVIFAADPDRAHEVRVVATDAFGPAPSAIQQLGVGFVLAQATEDMTGLAIGRRATASNTLDVDLPATFRDGITSEQDINFGEQTGEKALIFKNQNGTNPHNCVLYGGNPGSTTGVGIYDRKNNRSVMYYTDTTNTLSLGQWGTNLILGGQDLLLQTSLRVISNMSLLNNTPAGFSGYGRALMFGRTTDSDRYYLLVDSAGKLFTGRALNGAATITWAEK